MWAYVRALHVNIVIGEYALCIRIYSTERVCVMSGLWRGGGTNVCVYELIFLFLFSYLYNWILDSPCITE